VRNVAFHPDAQDEFAAAARYYEDQRDGLGLDFVLAVQRTYERLPEAPAVGAPFGGRLRRVLVPKFPYGLLYQADAARIYIVAVMHLHRRPGYWRLRL
jgi:plasmid stabilization system protein ParE